MNSRDGNEERNGNFYDDAMENVRYILQQNRSYLRWTYDELAFPVLSMNPMASASNQTSWSNRFAEVKVPAVRPHLDCRLISGKDVQRNLTLSVDDPDDNKIYIEPAVGICDPSASPDNTSAIRLKYTSLESLVPSTAIHARITCSPGVASERVLLNILHS